MSNARNLADIITGNFDVPLGALDNVPPSNDASALTTGTLPVGRLPSSGVSASSLTTGTLGTARLPAGSVIQVVTAEPQGSANSSTASGSYSDVASAQITPTSTSSKIIVLANAWAGCTRNGDQLYVAGRIVRRLGGDTIITPSNQQMGSAAYFNHQRYTPNVATSVITYRMVFNQVDSPATISTITYVWQHAALGSVSSNQTSGVQFILMEVAG